MNELTQTAKHVLVFAIVLFLIDIVWLVGARQLHEQQIMQIQRQPIVVDKTAAGLFYVIAGLMFATMVHKLSGFDAEKAACYGALIGAGMYFTFDLTNKAIFKEYKWKYVLLDGLWGTVAVGLASYVTTHVLRRLE